MARNATSAERAQIASAAAKLGTNAAHLEKLLRFETAGTFSPTIKNPTPGSTARGLIQFTNKTARQMGYADSLDLVRSNPTFATQLHGAVVPYLAQFKPFPTRQALYMSVFYPQARFWPRSKQFPSYVQAWNKNIRTVGDYVDKVEGRKSLPLLLPVIILGLTAAYYFRPQKREQAANDSPKTENPKRHPART